MAGITLSLFTYGFVGGVPKDNLQLPFSRSLAVVGVPSETH